MVLVFNSYLTVATDCIDMDYTVCVFGFPYLQLPREKRCTQFCIFRVAKGGGRMMHINQTFLLFMKEGKAQFECWAFA